MNSNEEDKAINYNYTSYHCLMHDRLNVGESKKELARELLRIHGYVSEVNPNIEGALRLAVRRELKIGRKEIIEVLKACRQWFECNDEGSGDYTDLNVGQAEDPSRWFAEFLLDKNATLLDDPNLESVSGGAAGAFDIWLCAEETAEVLAVCRRVIAYSGSDPENYAEAAIDELKDSLSSY